jgi:hypothetical protein
VLRRLEEVAFVRRRRCDSECRVLVALIENSENIQLARPRARVAGYQ